MPIVRKWMKILLYNHWKYSEGSKMNKLYRKSKMWIDVWKWWVRSASHTSFSSSRDTEL